MPGSMVGANVVTKKAEPAGIIVYFSLFLSLSLYVHLSIFLFLSLDIFAPPEGHVVLTDAS